MVKYMKVEKNILFAFLLNLGFSIFEFIGGILTNSVAIMSDAIHDIGDSLSIGISYFLEKKSKRKPDKKYTFGYTRYSILGGLITTLILIIGSSLMIYNSILRIFNPVDINYNGMIIFAVFGAFVNFMAAYLTRKGDSINQKAVNLHMFEDVLGWLVVLIGAVIMKFTDIKIIDPILSILVAIVIMATAFKTLRKILDLFLEKTNIDIDEIVLHLKEIDKVYDVHHIHIWSIDGINNYATMHIVTDEDSIKIKKIVREELKEHNIAHATIELEFKDEVCNTLECEVKDSNLDHHHHHH